MFACGGGEEPAGTEEAATEMAVEEVAEPAEAEGEPSADADAVMEVPELEASMTMCMGAADCVAVRLDCCGGCDAPVVAANRGHADAVKAEHGPKDCASAECPETPAECPEVEVTCAGGCKLVEAEGGEGEGAGEAAE